MMKQKRPFPAYTVSKKAETSLRSGHRWVFDEEVLSFEEAENGAIVDVFSDKGVWLGAGMFSRCSKLQIRMLSSNANETFTDLFWERRIGYALDYRKTVMGEYFPFCCRLIFGDADGLPGLTVDRYNDLLVAEILSYGIEQRKDLIYGALMRYFEKEGHPVSGIFERNEGVLRNREGLPRYKDWYRGGPVPVSAVTEITENGIRYKVDVENGQKTGFFLDQKYNRLAVSKLATGLKVLDCCTHTGSFALNAAKGGAAHVTAVDISQTALDRAKEHAVMNGLAERMDFICDDVFDLLPKLLDAHERFDLIVLDPPAFTKSKTTVKDATRGYRDINYRAMRLIPRGGYLVTCSCSHFMTDELFRAMLRNAARDAGVELRLVEFRRQSPDHPVLLNVPDSDYLKFYILQIV